jgi:hypothetical protein
VDADGRVWLGDYGSSVAYNDIEFSFCGGTFKYQCIDFSDVKDPSDIKNRRLFDFAGLVISFLYKHGCKFGNSPKSLSEIHEIISNSDFITAEQKELYRSLLQVI